jgi:hypothetical protein
MGEVKRYEPQIGRVNTPGGWRNGAIMVETKGESGWISPTDYDNLRERLSGKDGWEKNVEALLEQCPYARRVREGGGPENLIQSLALTFIIMQERLAEACGRKV